ncbi:MAG: GNAT family N-acetyltransferase, partial [Thermoanaerobaculia bacterium]
MSGSLSCELVSDFDRLEALSGDWRRLWAADPAREIFGSYPWVRAAWRALGRRRSLCTPVVREGERVVAILPMAREGARLEFITAPSADYNDLVAEPSAEPAALALALEALGGVPGWRHCRFEKVSQRANLLRLWRGLDAGLRRRSHLAIQTPCPSIVLEPRREEVLADLLSRQSLKRHEKGLQKLGELRFRHLEDRSLIREHLPRLFEQHRLRRVLGGGPSRFEDPSFCALYERLAEELDPGAELRFSLLELNGKPLAYHFGFELDGKLLWYKPTFDVDWWEQSPGEVLLRHLILYVRDHGLRELDFTCGDEPFKRRFANVIRENSLLSFYPAGVRGRGRRALQRAREGLKRRKSLYARARTLANWTRERLGASGRRLRSQGPLAFAGGALRRAIRAA